MGREINWACAPRNGNRYLVLTLTHDKACLWQGIVFQFAVGNLCYTVGEDKNSEPWNSTESCQEILDPSTKPSCIWQYVTLIPTVCPANDTLGSIFSWTGYICLDACTVFIVRSNLGARWPDQALGIGLWDSAMVLGPESCHPMCILKVFDQQAWNMASCFLVFKVFRGQNSFGFYPHQIMQCFDFQRSLS